MAADPASTPRSAAALRAVAWLLLAAPLLFAVYANLGAPRPYYVFEMDPEQDYYYNARLILEGKGPLGVHHPGTPVYYLGAALLRATGTDLGRTQEFLVRARLLGALITFGALLVFWRLCLAAAPAPAALLALAALLGWRPLYTYEDAFAADSFVLAAGLPTLALVWRVIRGPAARPVLFLALAGAGLGLCLAVKMSFVPVAIAVAACLLAWVVQSGAEGGAASGTARRAIVAFVGSAVASYAAFVSPIAGRVPWIWIETFHRTDVRPPESGLTRALLGQLGVLFQTNPAWFLLCLAGGLAFLAGIVEKRRGPGAGGLFARVSAPETILVGLLGLAFLYAIAASAAVSMAATDPGVGPSGPEAGIHFRNASPMALVLPFLFLGLADRPGAPAARLRRRTGLSVSILAVASVAWTVAGYSAFRARWIPERLRTIQATRSALAAVPAPGSRLAFWTGPSTDYLGEASFHFFGNYRYANDYFDRELIERFPGLTFFRGLREMRTGRIGPDRAPSPPSLPTSRFGSFGRAIWAFHEWFERFRPTPEKTEEFFAGERYGTRVGAIAIPDEEIRVELRKASSSRLPAFAAAALGGGVAAKPVRVDSVAWILLARDSMAPAAQDRGGGAGSGTK